MRADFEAGRDKGKLIMPKKYAFKDAIIGPNYS
jgi:hypothetical protein